MQTIMNFNSPKDAMEWATIIAKSKFCPKEFFNHPESVLVAIAYGAELGLKPLQALQNICVINGKPSIYGDAMLAVCKNSPDFEAIEEELIIEHGQFTAVCCVKRKQQPIVTIKFTSKDAELAGLWNKPGPWKQYPKRMLQMRARSFALRDCFPDVLKGMIAVEEAQDYQTKDVKPVVEELNTACEQKLIEDLSPAVAVDPVMQKLFDLLSKHQVPELTLQKWLFKAGVGFVHQLPTETMQKIIDHLESREELNGEN